MIEFRPPIESKGRRFAVLRRIAMDLLETETYVFDGILLFLLHNVGEKEIIFEDRGNEFRASLILTKTLDADEIPSQFYNMFFRQILRIMKLKQMGRQYFDPTRPIKIPKHRVELWPGYFTSINPNQVGMMLIADVTHKVLRTDTVLDFMYELSSNRNNWKEIVNSQMIGQIVLTRYNNRTYRVDDVMWDMNPRNTFEKRTGEYVSYISYYSAVHGIDIHEGDQPLLLHVRKRKGAPDETIYLVPELCTMTGITDDMRQDFHIMRDIAQHTRVSPEQRAYETTDFVQKMNNSREVQKELNDWGLGIATRPLPVEGRVLPPETVIFRSVKQRIKAETAEWAYLIKNSQLIEPIQLGNWLLVYSSKSSSTAQDFARKFIQVGNSVGFRAAQPKTVSLDNDHSNSFVKSIKVSHF